MFFPERSRPKPTAEGGAVEGRALHSGRARTYPTKKQAAESTANLFKPAAVAARFNVRNRGS